MIENEKSPVKLNNRIILVVGATGRQGGAVARQLLKEGWVVRALTRRTNSPAAIKIESLGANLFRGDLSDLLSLKLAMDGAYGIFGMTEFWEHGYAQEIEHGLNIIKAAQASGVEHIVFSSVGGIDRTEGLGIRHFDSKRVIEQHLKNTGIRYSILRPVTFFENFVSDRYRKSIRDGSFKFAVKPNIRFQMLAMYDLAIFAAQAFAGSPYFENQSVELASQRLTMEEFSIALGKAVGVSVRYQLLSRPMLWLLSGYVEITRQGGYYKTGWALLRMFNWMNETETGGWDADLPALHRQHSELMSAETWARTINWQ
jgi:uncharacterized protein YbjT (DUF2867 family)